MRFIEPLFFCVIAVFSGCKPYSYFNTSNDFQNKNCTIHFLSGRELKGKATIQLETGRLADKFIYLKANETTEKIAIDSIDFYTYNADVYCPKEIDFDAYTIPNKDNFYLPNQRYFLFMKRLTKENSKLNLYELFQSRIQSADGADHYYYFVSLPSENRLKASSIGSDLFFPRFDEKMSKIVSDCPELSDKIQRKQNGYALNQVSLELKKLEVFKRIAEEYNNCN